MVRTAGPASPASPVAIPDPDPAPDSRASSPLVIGVLGGIASGKSAVAALLAGKRGVVLDADRIAAEILESPEILERLRGEFGREVLQDDGRVDRGALGRAIFADSGAREKLEGWIHPRVRERISAGLREAGASGRSPVVLDVPLLVENDASHGLARRCDFLVFVETPAEVRDRRAQERRGWPPGEVARRERVQLPLSEKRALARHVIENRADLAELAARVRRVLEAENLP